MLGQHIVPEPSGAIGWRTGTIIAASDSWKVMLFGRSGVPVGPGFQLRRNDACGAFQPVGCNRSRGGRPHFTDYLRKNGTQGDQKGKLTKLMVSHNTILQYAVE